MNPHNPLNPHDVTLPTGFKAAGVQAGIKPSGKADLALICSDYDLNWAMVTTTNTLKAPFILRNRSIFNRNEDVRAIAINAGNANCANGEQGVWDNKDFAISAARVLGISEHMVLTASTGILGARLPTEKIGRAMPQLYQDLADQAGPPAQAIMTTDTYPKIAEAHLPTGSRVVGIAKGSGMIHPNMATMLAFIFTDARISQEALRGMWPNIVGRTFNQVTVDGDTSPNDSALLFTSSQLPASLQDFEHCLEDVCRSLARQIASDGEGATKLLTVRVSGARNGAEARKAARTVAVSPLVKSAAYGNDPNWGRILNAVGYSGVSVDITNVVLSIQGEQVYHREPLVFDASLLGQKMQGEELIIDIDLAIGDARAEAWGCDLTEEYVHINADYTT